MTLGEAFAEYMSRPGQSPAERARIAEASAEMASRHRRAQCQQEKAVRRQGEMHRARHEAVSFTRRADGSYSIVD